MSTKSALPKRGEIWLVNFDPTLGSEIKKIRPAIVISSDAVGRLPVKLVAPVTDWKPYFAGNLWHIQLNPNPTNGLIKPSAVDTLKLRGVDLRRFIRRLGSLSKPTMDEISLAVVAVIEADL